MEHRIVSGQGSMVFHCIRLKNGEDLLESIRSLCREKNISAGVILSGVGCILRGRVRDASGVTIREIGEHCEIVSLNGTVSARRCHVHIALSRVDMSTIGGHLCPGCIVNTTCELVIGEIPNISFDVEQDDQTGYDELIFLEKSAEPGETQPSL